MTKRGMNLSSLLSIVNVFITLNFFNTRRNSIGNMKVIPNTTPRHISAFMNETLQIPDAMNIRNIHVGNKTGCEIIDMN